METKLNIILFFAFVFVLGLNYSIKNENIGIEPKDETNLLIKHEMFQVATLIAKSKAELYSRSDTCICDYNAIPK